MKGSLLLLRLIRPLLRLILSLLFDIRIAGLNNVPRNEPYILVSNHLNWVDPFILLAHFPSSHRFVFAAEQSGLYDSNWKKALIKALGSPVIAFDRKDHHQRIKALKQMIKVLRSGSTLVVFPEGRVGPGEGDVYPFYVGAFMLSSRLRIPVLPVGLSGTHCLSFRKPIRLRVGTPMEADAARHFECFAERAALTVRELIPPYPGDGRFPNTMTWLTDLFLNGRKPDDGCRSLIIREKLTAETEAVDP